MPIIVILGLLIAWPFLEIAAFVAVGERIGIIGTIALTLLSSATGVLLLRIQGLMVLRKVVAGVQSGQLPPATIGHAALIALGGLLLFIPGFISDVIGLLLFIPPVRSAILAFLGRNIRVVEVSSSHASWRRRDGVVDLEESEWHASSERPKADEPKHLPRS